MRLFIAVNFSDEVKNKILALQEELKNQVLRNNVTKGNFSRRENFHITLAFLGETPEEKLETLFRIMEDLNPPPFEIHFNSTGCFSHSRKELWWVGADRNCPGYKVLGDIHALLLNRLLEAGFPVDTRPFNAHITLGREIKHTEPVILEKPDIIVKADRISLMKSERIQGALVYTELFGKGSIPSMDDLPHKTMISRSSPMATPEQAGNFCPASGPLPEKISQ